MRPILVSFSTGAFLVLAVCRVGAAKRTRQDRSRTRTSSRGVDPPGLLWANMGGTSGRGYSGDLHIEVPAVEYRDIASTRAEEGSAPIRARVGRARERQRARSPTGSRATKSPPSK